MRRRGAWAATVVLCFALLPVPAPAEITKSRLDTRDYRFLVLNNNLKVLLVSDPGTDRSAVAMNVAVGNGSDPPGREGMAHFLEHMLFLGTRKHPDPGEYQRFIRSHGGHRNAWTALERTVYYFDIDAAFLAPALDRFARFFTEPLFEAGLVERERNIVHSEYALRRDNDGRRMWAVMRAAYNPAHPMSRFAAGSRETLADRPGAAVRDELIAFFRAHYAAGVMTLVVLGREPPEVLQGWVEEHFSSIADYEVPPMMAGQPLFAPGSLPAVLYARPREERRRLELVFPVPELLSHYRSKPLHLVSSLVGHEGKGSLLSALKNKNWATAIHAGPGINLQAHATFGVNIMLTEEGLEQWREVAGYVFRYLDLVRERGLRAWRYEEEQYLAGIHFAYREEARPLSHVIELSGAMHRYPQEHLLNGPFLLESFEPEQSRRYLEHLHPGNALVVVAGRKVPVTDLSPHYGVDYSVQPLPPGWAAEAIAAAGTPRLPQPNRFIPRHLALKPEGSTPGPNADTRPQLLVDGEVLRLWHRNDVSFRTPHANLYFSVRSPRFHQSAAAYVLTGLYIKAASEALNEFSYAARVAGINYGMYQGLRGYAVRISGYDEKQPLLLERILKALRKPALDEERFNRYREELIRNLGNYRYDELHRQLYEEIPNLLTDPYWSPAERIAAAGRITYAEYRKFARELHRDLNVVMLAHGNVTVSAARHFGRMLERRLLRRARGAPAPRLRVSLLPTANRHYHRLAVPAAAAEAEQAGAALVYIQGRNRSAAERARFALLSELLGPLFYDEFRVRRDLGYVVLLSNTPLVEVPGLTLVVQSSSYAPQVLERHMEEFLGGAGAVLAAMPQAEFAAFKTGLIGKLNERHQSLDGRSEVYWREIVRGHEQFNSDELLKAQLHLLTRERLAAFLDELVAGERANRLVIEAGGPSGTGDASGEGVGPGPAPERPAYPPGPPVLLKDGQALRPGVGRGADGDSG